MRDLRWIIPSALIVGALLSLAQPGSFWIGWLGFSFALALGGWGLASLWRWAGGGKALAWMLALALFLRLAAGVAITLILPVGGYDTEQQNAGYVFFDSYRRDTQAWELTKSDASIFKAFDKTYSADQYGGLLALSATVYRFLSPDAHRPLLISLLASLAGTIGVAFIWKASNHAWDKAIALPATWLIALYPESVLLGSAQMREPFLVTFIAIILWGFINLLYAHQRYGWVWMSAGVIGLLLFSPGILLYVVIFFAGWWGFTEQKSNISWKWLFGLTGIITFALLLFIWGATRDVSFGNISLASALDWFIEASHWDFLLLERSSGWVQKLFGEMPESLRIPFVVVYGLLQPVLPAAIIEPSKPIWQTIGIMRAIGWYLVLPFLVYSFAPAFLEKDSLSRKVWSYFATMTWLWIFISALRAGGDQWDNPRYRVMMLAFQAILFGFAWANCNTWFWRIVAIEGIFLAFFTQWYISRYYVIWGQIPFFAMVLIISCISAIILIGGAIWDKYKAHKPA